MATKKEQLAQDVAKAVGAGKAVALEIVDFNDPNRAKTCLEVDFPILPVNQVAIIEGNASKPIYQMSKWWARRRSSIFRSMLIAAATRAPEESSHAAKLVWDNYYANHQKKGAFKNLKVADIFMGGGTTMVEGSRLGMQMFGNDLNPVAWFIVKQEFANVDIDEVTQLLADIEAAVKPQIMPYYYCDGPNGEKGKWTHLPTKRVMGQDFDPLRLTVEQRRDYSYDGPEIIYTFWAKHGPCQVTGCGHRTPIMSSPVMAIKSLTVKYWDQICGKCGTDFHVEQDVARMAPDVPLYVAPGEHSYSVLDPKRGIVCPHCGHTTMVRLGKGKNKKVELSLLIQPQWLAGSPKNDINGHPFGGSAQDDVESTARWNQERASKILLLEVRGELPEEVICPDTNTKFKTDKNGGTIPKKSHFSCAACGTVQDVLTTIRATGKTGPTASYAIQGFAPKAAVDGGAYNGRFFEPFNDRLAKQFDAALQEWDVRKHSDLAAYWPKSELPFGFMTHLNNGGIPNHGFTHWWTMFNSRQLLVHSQLLKAIMEAGNYSQKTREYVLGGFQQYLRNQSLFTLWNLGADKLEPMFANNNYHPKSTVVENSVFANLGRGNWKSCVEGIVEGATWARWPWDTVSVEYLKRSHPEIAGQSTAKGEKAFLGDPLMDAVIAQGSATDLSSVSTESVDLVITDPPFGGLLHYSELSDFFYVWLRLALKGVYPDQFNPEFTPKSLEAVANRAREPEDPDGFYQRLLTQCWVESKRILKPGGILAFTFHHSEDEPWVAVLESLFDAGFYLEATYPIRSDETKGEGAKPGTFGSQTIEYDIIHVCRKRTEEPTPVSWGRMRREVLADVRQLQAMLENHAKQGLPVADLQVIRRGKALEYFSRHYGKVYVDEGRTINVKDALVGINQLIDEDSNKAHEPPPVNAEPITRQFLRIFDGKTEISRDQMHKFLRGSGMAPDEFEQRGWCTEKNKVFSQINPLEFAVDWHGRHKRKLTSDLDQSLVLIGACFDGSGINASDTLKNENFKPHVALKPLLEWLSKRGVTSQTRNGASRALSIYNNWAASNEQQVRQMSLFFDEA
jgi:adenine-specific DNA methylase